jgi:CRISPR/Cas system-associated exonuclease Cas4 (RecB family)
MNAPAPGDARTIAAPSNPRVPHLSHSRVSKYLHCPEQYRLHYVENLRPRVPDANLVFGQLVHQALAQLFRTGADPAESFDNAWLVLANELLTYSDRESWQVLRDKGAALLRRFVAEEAPRIGAVRAVEKQFTLTITNLGAPLVGIIDLVAELDAALTVIDFKTAKSAYPEHEVALSDQLTAYQLAEPDAEQVAFCIFVKTKEPRIDRHISRREGANLRTYLAKVEHIAGQIVAGNFYQRPGRWCSYCDFLPVCLGDEQKVRETLVKVTPLS